MHNYTQAYAYSFVHIAYVCYVLFFEVTGSKAEIRQVSVKYSFHKCIYFCFYLAAIGCS